MILIIFSCIFSILPLFSSAQSINSTTDCLQTCGDNRVPYPFGFSNGCQIQLNCTTTTSNPSSTIEIAGFPVQSWSPDNILISLPPNCTRSIENFRRLFSDYFAPTRNNGLLLENCSAAIDDCLISSRLTVNTDCNYPRRNGHNSTMSCYHDSSSEYLNYRNVESRGNCSVMFSSVLMNSIGNLTGFNGNASLSVEFQTLELGWWLNGICSCDRNANCIPVNDHGEGNTGFRCKCNQGYAGDGFANGNGCQIVCSTRSRWHIGQCGGIKVGILVGGIAAGALSVAALIFICSCLKKRSTALKSRLSAKRLLSDATGNSSVPYYPYKEIERATNGFSEKQRLGTGAYGTVYSGKLHNDEWVAIKKIRNRDNDSIEQVMNEIKLLSSVSHPNLVRLLGCCIENGEQILVYEYMANGTLSQHLQRERGVVLPWTTRLTIASETARAITHLHSIHPPIYHRDIKSSNILLDYTFNSKVADFGLSRIGMLDDSHISTAPQGTPGYVDPQYHQNFHLSDKSDVYSFGVVLVEIITAMKVVDFSRPHSEINLAALAIDRIRKGCVDEIIDPFVEPNRDAWTLFSVNKVAELAFRCLAFHRDMRPSMMEVADELEQIRVSSWASMEDNMCMGSSVASSCSSSFAGSEKSLNTTKSKKVGISSRILIVPHRVGDGLGVTKEAKDSPVSVQDPWLSEQSSPSTNSLLGNVVL